jgi:hypothetical protein
MAADRSHAMMRKSPLLATETKPHRLTVDELRLHHRHARHERPPMPGGLSGDHRRLGVRGELAQHLRHVRDVLVDTAVPDMIKGRRS